MPLSSESFPIVCLGGSAGALPAYRAILRGVPADSRLGIVIVSHRQSGFDGLVAPLLQSRTRMPVCQVVSGQRLMPGTVVFSPADRDLKLVEGRLFLSARVKERGWPTTITRFLRSLARDAGPHAVAVILSGLGNDGSAGIASIKQGGGVTVAQADAKWPAMPTHAIDTGLIDAVLPGDEIGKAIAQVAAMAIASPRTAARAVSHARIAASHTRRYLLSGSTTPRENRTPLKSTGSSKTRRTSS